MSVTLDVSKFSGWLNADANCRESKGGHAVRGEPYGPGGGRVAGDRGGKQRAGGRARLQIRGRAWRGAHPEHAEHACDAGGVEAQRLVERYIVLPRVETKAYTMRSEARAGRREAEGDHGGKQRSGRGLDCRLGAGHGEKRTQNMPLMSVTLDVSKLSGWLNADATCPGSEGVHTVRGEVCAGRRKALGDSISRSVQGRVQMKTGETTWRGAPCNLGVEYGCVKGVRHTQRACRLWVRPEAQGRAGEKRTRNISSMFVTPEVFQFDMSALKFFKFRKSSLMSVISETSHLAMGPYFAVAAVEFALYAWTAFFKEALSVKVAATCPGQVPGPQPDP